MRDPRQADELLEVARNKLRPVVTDDPRLLAGINPRVFTNSTGGPIYRRNLQRTYKELLQQAKCPLIRFHDLRHTAATLLIAGGVPIKVVAETLGHSRPSITIDIYVHALPCQERMAADAMDKLFGAA